MVGGVWAGTSHTHTPKKVLNLLVLSVELRWVGGPEPFRDLTELSNNTCRLEQYKPQLHITHAKNRHIRQNKHKYIRRAHIECMILRLGYCKVTPLSETLPYICIYTYIYVYIYMEARHAWPGLVIPSQAWPNPAWPSLACLHLHGLRCDLSKVRFYGEPRVPFGQP